MASITLDRVSKRYPNGFQAVQDLSIDISDGEFMVLVGPSGCGKTTALRMVAGLEDISSGTLSIGGRVVNEVAPKERDVAMVFQNYALYPHMTVAENIGFSLELRKLSKSESRQRFGPRPTSSGSPNGSTASRRSCRADNGNGWPWEGRSCAIPACS